MSGRLTTLFERRLGLTGALFLSSVEKLLVDGDGDYWCRQCRDFWDALPAVVVEHGQSCVSRHKPA